jgi:hypothetical protein
MIDGKDVIAFGVEMDEFYLEDDMVAWILACDFVMPMDDSKFYSI